MTIRRNIASNYSLFFWLAASVVVFSIVLCIIFKAPRPSNGVVVEGKGHVQSAESSTVEAHDITGARAIAKGDESIRGSQSADHESSSTTQGANSDDAMSELARKLGTSSVTLEKKQTVFVFVDGEYLDSPFKLRRDGFTVTINNKRVYDHPPVQDGYETECPKVPEILGPKSSREEIWGKRIDGKTWLHRFVNWHFSHETPDVAADAVIKKLRKMPFVRAVEIQKDYFGIGEWGDREPMKIGWKITTHRDETILFHFRNGYRDLRPMSADEFDSLLNRQLFNVIRDAVSTGGVLFVRSEPSCVAYHAAKDVNGIAIIHDVMKSSVSKTKKCEVIESALSIDDVVREAAREHIQRFVELFKENQHFDSAVESILKVRALPRLK